MLKIGVIADDFTGASDAASFIQKGGLRTLLSNGIPNQEIKNIDALVIALKTRSISPKKAIKQSVEAFEYLKKMNAQIIYNKYASTFDSTKQGNIGPISDALLEKSNESFTILCPSLPVNGRTIKNGHLYVYGVPLHQSSLKYHPLNPMWASSIKELMKEQSKYPVYLENEKPDSDRYYLVPDYQTQEDAYQIVKRYQSLSFLTGGSGLLEPLARQFESESTSNIVENTQETSKSIILVGSLSEMSGKQIEYYRKESYPFIQLDSTSLPKPSAILNKMEKLPFFMIASSRTKQSETSQNLECFFADLATLAQKYGYQQIIVGGGETSGAVSKALGYQHYFIGESVAPGVPILRPLENPKLQLVLKSGNFGNDSFFVDALNLTGGLNESTTKNQ